MAGSSRWRRPASHAVRRWRERSMRARPASVMATSTKRRSVGSAVRSTRPSASSLATTFVTDGGATCSISASAPSVSGPW